jgi:hypothetical protein
MEYVGIDLHKKESQICLLTETGEVSERRIRTGIDSWPTRADAYYRILGPDSRNRLPPATREPWRPSSWWWSGGRSGVCRTRGPSMPGTDAPLADRSNATARMTLTRQGVVRVLTVLRTPHRWLGFCVLCPKCGTVAERPPMRHRCWLETASWHKDCGPAEDGDAVIDCPSRLESGTSSWMEARDATSDLNPEGPDRKRDRW